MDGIVARLHQAACIGYLVVVVVVIFTNMGSVPTTGSKRWRCGKSYCYYKKNIYSDFHQYFRNYQIKFD